MHRVTCIIMLLLGAIIAGGCQSGGGATRQFAAGSYYHHRYAEAREAVRSHAADRRSEHIVLDSLRLGLASMADGDLDESERALMQAYEYLVSGGVNEADRVVSSTVLHEGTRVWKGEPYEQAMAFYYIAALYMMRGDWENGRAAASNSLFALRDFKAADMQDIGERAQRDGDFIETGWDKVQSEFTLGYLLAATNYVLMNQPDDATRMFEHVRKLRPDLAALVDTLQGNDYDTLLLVDSGRGPRKQSYGPDDSLVRYVPDGRHAQPLALNVSVGGHAVMTGSAVVDLWTLSQFPRWWSLEGMRKAKSAIGNVMLVGGLAATAVGANSRSRNSDVMYAGLGAAAAGLLLKATASADTRHLEMLPRGVFLVPIKLGPQPRDIKIDITGPGGARAAWHDIRGGAPGNPQVYYLRMHDAGGQGMPRWSDALLYSVNADQYRPGDLPWLMGGKDLTPPTPGIVEAYHSAGVLPGITESELSEAYRAEGLFFRPGPQGRSGEEALDTSLYRHVAEGGRVYWQPRPGTHLYERLTRMPHAAYAPRSQLLADMVSRSESIAQPPHKPDGVISRPVGAATLSRSQP